LVLLTAGAVVASLVMAPGQAAASHPRTPHTTIDVVSEGLDTPRGLYYEKLTHTVLIAEAGQVAGDDGPCAPGANSQIWCVGKTGAVSAYNEFTHQTYRIVTGLTSTRTGDETVPPSVLGVDDLSLVGGKLTLVFGLSGRQTFRDALGPDGANMATIGTVDWHGDYHPYGDLLAFEMANNPDGKRFDSDAYGLTVTRDGAFVADAGANSVLKATSDGTISLVVSPPPRVIPTDADFESVPTSVLQAPDGSFYISELTGFPYPPGTARVLRYVPGQPPTGTPLQEVATGFTNITDTAFDERGRLIVLEMAKNGLTDPVDAVTGRLTRIECDGSKTVLATTGLENPGSVVVTGTNEFYVSNRTTSAGDVGQLLRIRAFDYPSPVCH